MFQERRNNNYPVASDWSSKKTGKSITVFNNMENLFDLKAVIS